MDNARENIALASTLPLYRVAVKFTTAYTPSQNGVAERLNHTLI